jgi:hypothetical protein
VSFLQDYNRTYEGAVPLSGVIKIKVEEAARKETLEEVQTVTVQGSKVGSGPEYRSVSFYRSARYAVGHRASLQ